ncbi:MAG: LVIVD repeat-containing protein [Actinomycetota bacterium]
MFLRKISAVAAALTMVFTGAATTATARQSEDVHSDNVQQLARVPIKIAAKNVAEGSDLAFRGNLLVAGTYQGVGFFRILEDAPYLKQISFFNCPASQGDVSIRGDLVFVSINTGGGSNTGRSNVCNNTDNSQEKAGVRVVDISDLRQPRQVAFVETDCGSHTHTLMPDGDMNYLYIQSYPLGAQTPTCSVVSHRKVSIVAVPSSAPEKAKVANTLDVSPQIGCHDVSVFPSKDIAGAACIGESQIWDIKNPAQPEIIARIYNPFIGIHHSAALTWDAKKLVLGDEFAGSVTGACAGSQQSPIGAMWFYDITDPTSPQLEGYYNTPRDGHPGSAEEATYMACTTHNLGILPMKNPSKYIATVPYRAAGLSIVDFSDPANPEEIGFYHQLTGGIPDIWSAYWYQGRIYTNDNGTARGVSVYEMKGLDASAVRFFRGDMNPQTQIPNFR